MNIKLAKLNFFVCFTLLAVLLGVLPTRSVQAATAAIPLQASGNFGWAKGMGGSNSDSGNDIALDSSNNVYTTGSFEGTADFDPGENTTSLNSAGSSDIFISKLDSSGNFVWAKKFGGTGNDIAYSIAIDSNDNIYVTGIYASTAINFGGGDLNNAGSNDIFLVKLDTDGNHLWSKSFGGSMSDDGTRIALDTSANVYISGYFESSTINFGGSDLTNAGNNDIFVAKFDGSGAFTWAKAMGGTNNDQSWGLALDSNANVYTTGYFFATADFDPGASTANKTSAGDEDIFVSKLDSNGDFVWVKTMGGTNSDVSYGIAVDSSGNVHTTGYYFGTCDFDPGAGVANLTSVDITTLDVFVSKLNTDGDYVWAKSMGGASYDVGYGMTVDSLGNVYTTGQFLETGDYDPGASTFNLTSSGDYDVFVVKFDSAGSFLWAKSMGGPGEDSGNSIALSSNGNVFYTTGSFNATASFDPGDNTTTITSAGSADIFVSKLFDYKKSAFASQGANDGWILESGENTSVGGTKNHLSPTFNLGDDAANKQYRGMLSFNTAGLPDTAIITKVSLKVKRAGTPVGGGNPVSIFQGFMLDLKKGVFDTSALALGDFRSSANKTVGPFSPSLNNGWYTLDLITGKAQINKNGLTQMRLRFNLGDNNNLQANILKLHSGNASVANNRPQLIVEYYIP